MTDVAVKQPENSGITGFMTSVLKGTFNGLANPFGGYGQTFQNIIGSAGEKLVSNDTKTDMIYKNDDPAKFLFDQMAAKKAGDPEALKKIDTIRSDAAFMGSLNKAIKSDRKIAVGFVEAQNGGGEFKDMGDPDAFVNLLQNKQDRGIFTKVLNAVGQSADDDLDSRYIAELTKAKNDNDAKKLQGLLKKADVSDIRVDMAADPMKAMNNFWKDPSGTVRALMGSMDLSGMDPNHRNMLLGVADLMGNIVAGITNPRGDFAGPYLQLGRRIGEELAERGDTVARKMGVDTPNDGWDGIGPNRKKYEDIKMPKPRSAVEETETKKSADAGTTVDEGRIKTRVDIAANFDSASTGLYTGGGIKPSRDNDNDVRGPVYGNRPGMSLSIPA